MNTDSYIVYVWLIIGIALTAVMIDTCGRSLSQGILYTASGIFVLLIGITSLTHLQVIIIAAAGMY